MSKRQPLSDEDIALFRQAVQDVTPLEHDLAPPYRRRRPAYPQQTRLDEVAVLQDLLSDAFEPADVEIGDELLFRRDGIPHGLWRKLRRGRLSIGAELDLHGYFVPEARAALVEFLNDSRRRGLRCVRIVHGKGHGSRGREPVLKGRVDGWLRQRDEVLAFCSAPLMDGGTGAVYVLLRSRRR